MQEPETGKHNDSEGAGNHIIPSLRWIREMGNFLTSKTSDKKQRLSMYPWFVRRQEQLKVLLKIKETKAYFGGWDCGGLLCTGDGGNTSKDVHITTLKHLKEKRIVQAHENSTSPGFAERITLLEGDATGGILKTLVPFL